MLSFLFSLLPPPNTHHSRCSNAPPPINVHTHTPILLIRRRNTHTLPNRRPPRLRRDVLRDVQESVCVCVGPWEDRSERGWGPYEVMAYTNDTHRIWVKHHHVCHSVQKKTLMFLRFICSVFRGNMVESRHSLFFLLQYTTKVWERAGVRRRYSGRREGRGREEGGGQWALVWLWRRLGEDGGNQLLFPSLDQPRTTPRSSPLLFSCFSQPRLHATTTTNQQGWRRTHAGSAAQQEDSLTRPISPHSPCNAA